MKNLFRFTMIAATIALLATACGEGDDDGRQGPPPSKLTPDQHKVKLEQIGKDFTSYFSAEESRAAIESLQTLVDLLSQDEEVMIPDYAPEELLPIVPMTRSILATLGTADPGALMEAVTRAALRYSIAGELGSNGMVYTYDRATEEWKEQPSDERKITANYADERHDSQITLVYSAEKTDYTYKPENAVVEVPRRMELTLQVDKKQELTLTLAPNLSSDGLTLKPEARLEHGTLTVTADGEANPNFIVCNGEIAKNDTTIVTAYAKVVVSDMTDTNNWIVTGTDWDGSKYDYVDPSDHFADYVKTGEATLQLLTARVVGQGDIRKIIDQTDKIEESWTQTGAAAEAAICNANMDIYLAYTDDDTKAADVVMDVKRDEWQTYNWETNSYTTHYDYYTEPILVFGDGSKTSFESYFTRNRFSSLFDAIEKLMEGYDNILH